MRPDPATVLVVDDEPHIVELFSGWLEDAYEVRSASTGGEALAVVGDEVDVVLLDRRLPGLDGSEVLSTIREEGYDCRVAMVTAVEPDVDVVEMGFDDYLVKPVSRDELRDLVASLLAVATYDGALRELYALASKHALLRRTMDEAARAESEAVAALERRLREKRREAADLRADLDPFDYERLFREGFDGDGGSPDIAVGSSGADAAPSVERGSGDG